MAVSRIFPLSVFDYVAFRPALPSLSCRSPPRNVAIDEISSQRSRLRLL